MNNKCVILHCRLKLLQQHLDSQTPDQLYEGLTGNPRSKEPKLRCVGRLKRSCYMHKGKLVSTHTFTLLKRKSQLSLEGVIDDASLDIDGLQLGNYEDGVYEIRVHGGVPCWETGAVDDWELILVPYVEEENV